MCTIESPKGTCSADDVFSGCQFACTLLVNSSKCLHVPWMGNEFLKSLYSSLMMYFQDMHYAWLEPVIRLLTFKTLREGLTHCSSWAGRQLAPFHLLTAPPCSVGGAVANEIIPHGVTHSPVKTGVHLMQRRQYQLIIKHSFSVSADTRVARGSSSCTTALSIWQHCHNSQHRRCRCCILLQRWWVVPGCTILPELILDRTAVFCC